MTTIAVAILLLCVFGWYLVTRNRGGVSLVAADVSGGGRRWTLKDPRLNVEAVADHVLSVIDAGGHQVMFPHELKPTRRARKPYTADVVQLGAQMAGLQAEVGSKFAGFGILEYSGGRQFRIEWNEDVAATLARAVGLVRTLRAARTPPPRTHNEAHICQHCPVRESCDQRLS